MTRTGDREIGVVSGRLPDNTGELACMQCIKGSLVESALFAPLIIFFFLTNIKKEGDFSIFLQCYLKFFLAGNLTS